MARQRTRHARRLLEEAAMKIARYATVLIAAGTMLALSGVAMPAGATASHRFDDGYQQINLVSDLPGMAQLQDPNLVNPWGLSSSPTSPLWVSDNGTDKTTL